MPPSEDELRQLTDTDLDKVETFSKAKKTSVLVVFFDDMKGSSVLKQQMTVLSDEDVFQDLRREHDELLTQVITRDGVGEVIKSTGDGLLAVLTEPSVAVERALEIQEKLYRHPYLRVRIGLDMGQVRSEAAGGVQRDLFGRHVDWAARAESLADGGHILVTRSVYTDAFGWIPKQRVSWKEQGYYVVKDGEPAIEVFEPYNGNITGPLERLHGKKVSDSWQHRAEIHARLNALKIPLLLLSLLSWLMLSWGKKILAILIVLTLFLIGFIGWNRPLRHVPEAIWMLLPLYNQPPPVPLSTNQNLATNQILKYYGDRENNETGKRFDKELSKRFKIDTGIEVKVTSPPQDDRLYRLKSNLEQQSPEFDVILIDIIWVGELAEHLIDLTSSFSKESDEYHNALIENNTVDGKLVAIPWFEDFGLLYYRKDLLSEQGYKDPPASWEQLEEIAAKIQQQYSKKRVHFIGFAWQGASYEGLICNALEWIASRGGYNTKYANINDRQTVVDALESARDWSQGPRAISYGVNMDTEEESLKRFRDGDAAFLRMWSSAYAKLKQANVSFDVAPLPAKNRQNVSIVGGWQLAVPKYSRHPDAAVEFIRYLTSPEVQTWRALQGAYLPTINTVTTKLQEEKQLSSLYNAIGKAQRITRPSTRLRGNYEQASACFREAVRSALALASREEVKNAVFKMEEDPGYSHCQKFLSQP